MKHAFILIISIAAMLTLVALIGSLVCGDYQPYDAAVQSIQAHEAHERAIDSLLRDTTLLK